MSNEKAKRDSSANCDSTSDSEKSGSGSWVWSGPERKPRFSVTSCDTGLKLKIAAVPAPPPRHPPAPPRPRRPRRRRRCLSDTSSSSHSCSKCSSSSSSEDDLPLRTVTERRHVVGVSGTDGGGGAAEVSPDEVGEVDAGGGEGAGGNARSSSTSSSSSSSSTTSTSSSSSSSDDTDHQTLPLQEDAPPAASAAAAAAAPPAPPPLHRAAGGGPAGAVQVHEQDSSSEMELEPQLVSLVQRAAAADDSDADGEPTQLYANTLLQQFVAQTQLLSTAAASATASPAPASAPEPAPAPRRRRGRPRKQRAAAGGADEPHEPNVSPDSGILSSHNSPAHSPQPPTPAAPLRGRHVKREAASPRTERKLDIAALDRMLYATDRVLYPPRRRTRAPPDRGDTARDSDSDSCGRDRASARRSVLAEVYAKRKDVHAQLAALAGRGGAGGAVDPAWRQIDLNRKYKDIVSGYRSDHEAKPYRSCSRLMESGYRSDYGARATSGYRTDRSGAGYRTDHGGRERRRRRPARRTRSARDRLYYRHKHFVSEQDVAQLATDTLALLSLAGSDEPASPLACPPAPRALCPPHVPADPFAPAPVFSPAHDVKAKEEPPPSDDTSRLKAESLSVPLPANKMAFTHKFGCLPVAVATSSVVGHVQVTNDTSTNNNILKQLSQNVSPKKNTKSSAGRDAASAITNIFEKAINSYIPNERLSRNAFVSSQRSSHRVRLHAKKHKRCVGVVIAPPKIKLEPSGRPSRPVTVALDELERSRRSRSHSRHRRRRSRSASRARVAAHAAPADLARFAGDMDELLAVFLQCCHIVNASPALEKPPEPPPAPTRCVKRSSKKRKAVEGGEVSTGGAKRRHKKQSAERDANTAGDTDNTNEHKLPLKKRHYHINSAPRAVLPAPTDAAVEPLPDQHTDDELDAIRQPSDRQSELSKKIYEASEKLKAVNKMVHDLERSLPKSDDKETEMDMKPKSDEAISPKTSSNQICVRKAGPVVTPKKRHRLEPDKLIVTSSLDHVVESLARKLAEERPSPAPGTASPSLASSLPVSHPQPDPLKCMSLRTLCKSSIPPAQKSEIMTRKKNRLEGLTSNLVSKISPSTATKMLDTLMNNNIRKSIECRIQEKNKANAEGAGETEETGPQERSEASNTRASVIKSPVWRGRSATRASAYVETTVVVDVDRPTGIFEPSVDLELHIPKSSISLSCVTRSDDARTTSSVERDVDVPLALASGATDDSLGRAARGGSIASVISDKIQEQTASGHNLRPHKRTPASSPVPVDKKKKNSSNNIIKAGKLLLPSKKMQTSVPSTDTVTVVIENDTEMDGSDIKLTSEHSTDAPAAAERKLDTPVVKKLKRRKTINRTGFPSIKKKKKKKQNEERAKVDVSVSAEGGGDATVTCDRVPHEGEATASFVERTHSGAGEVRADTVSDAKVESGGRERRARLSVISLERLQGKPTPPAPPDACSSAEEEDSIPLSRLHVTPDPPSVPAVGRQLKRTAETRRGERAPSCKRRSTRRLPSADRTGDHSESEPLPPEERECSPLTARSESAPSAPSAAPSAKRNPRMRKKFLPAGLFSQYYKRDKVSDANGAETETPRPGPLLAPPPYCERWVRQRRQHFTLPYDIWWQHHHSQAVPSWNYKKIRSNVYHEARPPAEECEAVACNCAPDSGCPEDCINRLVYAECAPQLCPCGERCRNQRIQRHEWAPALERFMTPSKGWGVRCGARITCGDFILEYVGEVVSDKEFKERMASRYARDTHHYCLHLDGGLVIDGHRMGGEGRFVNHSCRPNCEMQKWTANGTFRMALFALRDIAPGEELTYDYNFSLFNPAEGQVCKCGWDECRGVIGGKSQRVCKPAAAVSASGGAGGVARRAGRPRKPAKCSRKSSARAVEVASCGALCGEPAPPPMTSRERALVRERRCFLLRALRARPPRAPRAAPPQTAASAPPPAPAPLNPSVTLTRLHVRGDKLNSVLRDMCQHLHKEAESAAGDAGAEVWSGEVEGLSLANVARQAADARYTSVAQFDAELSAALAAHVRARTQHAHALHKAYAACRVQYVERLRAAAPGETLPASFLHKHKTEEVIQCICGLHAEEGLMVQCGGAGCGVWQHARCMRVTDTAAPHRCHACLPRPLDREIPLDEYTDEGHRFYLSLLRGELQVRQGDTVYVLRDIPVDRHRPDASAPAAGPAPAPPAASAEHRKRARKKEEVRKHTYRTIGDISVSELDIFRVERLWRHKHTGERFVYGHHYLRPHETYHEPTRKFFPNEVMRVPLYEAVPIELVMSQCWVLDLNTYCKGRPVGAREEHVYICELRVDRGARLFSKVSRNKYPMCTKSYAFTHFPQRVKISRTYAPHEVSPEYLKGRGGGRRGARVGGGGDGGGGAQEGGGGGAGRSREQQKERLMALVSRLAEAAAAAAERADGGGRSPRRARLKPAS